MLPTEAFEILKNSRIPFAVGQSSIYGADCSGLVWMFYNMTGVNIDISHIPRRYTPVPKFRKLLEESQFELDPDGFLAFYSTRGIGHCGITDGVVVVHQNNLINHTEVVENPYGVERYKLRGYY
jgi:cell wall-associated NlpC family hydrolase